LKCFQKNSIEEKPFFKIDEIMELKYKKSGLEKAAFEKNRGVCCSPVILS
jgi:hypothetical protein